MVKKNLSERLLGDGNLSSQEWEIVRLKIDC